VPPWNSYDVSTLKAADRAGFRFFSSYLADPVDTTLSLSFVPCTTSLRSLKEHIDLARSTAGGVVVVLFHGYDFYESRSPNASATLGQLEETLRWLGEQNDVVVARMGELSGLKGTRLNLAATEYGKAVARRGESLELIRRYIPPGLRELASKGVVATIWLFYGGLVFATWVGSFFCGCVVSWEDPHTNFPNHCDRRSSGIACRVGVRVRVSVFAARIHNFVCRLCGHILLHWYVGCDFPDELEVCKEYLEEVLILAKTGRPE